MRHLDINILLLAFLLFASPAVLALKSDRQQQLLINADTTEGTLGDGTAVLRGNVEIHQGSILVRADQAEVEKVEGRVRLVLLTGTPVLLQQEIEKEGLVTATAETISYQVGPGIVTLTGAADVNHPQYHISGEVLIYDLNLQHFQGSGGDGNGRIRIELEPEVVPEIKVSPEEKPAGGGDGTATPSTDGEIPQDQEGASHAQG
jgi:lipopolysaccharide export system protein LptA